MMKIIMYRSFLVCLTFISSCCAIPPPPSCLSEITKISKEDRKLAKQKLEEKRAWRHAKNEELVSALESADMKKWTVSADKKIVLGELYNLGIYLNHNKVIFRISIFQDGTLFLDGEKEELSITHISRLTSLFNKILGGKNGKKE